MEQLLRVVRSLRLDYKFQGYIHLKTIPEADPLLVEEAGRLADRLSINIELPKDNSITTLAPEKSGARIRKAMAGIKLKIDEARPSKKDVRRSLSKPPRFSPAGHSTQMIIGADASTDADILGASTALYASYGLRRVYYSAYSPIQDASKDLPPVQPPLLREHRLYQADWLLRFYGFEREEIVATDEGDMLDLDIDPKLAWALRHRGLFPLDINRADKKQLLRVPGLGAKGVQRILSARRYAALRFSDLARLTQSVEKIRPFITAVDWTPGSMLDAATLRARFAPPPKQLSLPV